MIGSGPAGLAAAQQLARAGHAGRALREGRSAGRAAALRHPRLQAGEARPRPPPGADGRRGRAVRARRGRGQGHRRRASCGATFDAVCLCMGAGQPRPLAVPGAELAGRPLRHGFSHPAEPPRRRRRRPQRQSAGHRRPRASTSSSSAAATPAATASARRSAKGPPRSRNWKSSPSRPRASNPETPWPDWPRDHADLLLAGRRLPAALEHADQGTARQRRPRRATPLLRHRVGRAGRRAGRCGKSPAANSPCRPTWC